MRHLVRSLALVVSCLLAASAIAQEGKVLYQRNIRIPRDATFGEETLRRGSYRLALTEIDGEKWFVLSKAGREVARDLAIEMPVGEIPTQGLQAEILKGEEYYRVRVRQGDKVYLIHFLLKGGKV